ncbi:hypothetical protein ONZ45_g10544 [Pleurotus djamor]|nr:hypothetical protein ONZ45_g10544 [Pleurotus djamor]
MNKISERERKRHHNHEEDHCSPIKLVERSLPLGYINRLTPPAGTNFWRHQTFNVMRNQELTFTILNSTFLLETLTWNIDAYVYAVNAHPGSDFTGRGGLIYVVLVHSGSAATGQMVGAGTEYRYNVTMKSPPSGAAALKQFPPSNSGIINGDNTNYTISFAQDMQMFKNGGNELFTFQSQYEDSLDLRKGEQMGFVNGDSGFQWAVQFDPAPEQYSNFPFASVSVCRLSSFSEVTFECAASIAGSVGLQTRTITVDCRF